MPSAGHAEGRQQVIAAAAIVPGDVLEARDITAATHGCLRLMR